MLYDRLRIIRYDNNLQAIRFFNSTKCWNKVQLLLQALGFSIMQLQLLRAQAIIEFRISTAAGKVGGMKTFRDKQHG